MSTGVRSLPTLTSSIVHHANLWLQLLPLLIVCGSIYALCFYVADDSERRRRRQIILWRKKKKKKRERRREGVRERWQKAPASKFRTWRIRHPPTQPPWPRAHWTSHADCQKGRGNWLIRLLPECKLFISTRRMCGSVSFVFPEFPSRGWPHDSSSSPRPASPTGTHLPGWD